VVVVVVVVVVHPVTSSANARSNPIDLMKAHFLNVIKSPLM
jgi:hypothetical protein